MNEASLDRDREARAFAESAALARLPGRSQIELSGADRAAFLQVLTTNDVKLLAPWQGCESFLCNAQGKTIGHGYVFCFPEFLVLDTVPGQATGLLTHLDRYLFREKVVLRDRSDDWAEWILAGPRAASILEQLGAISIPLARCGHALAPLAGIEVSLRRADLVGGDCFLLSCATPQCDQLATVLAAAGAVSVGPLALDAARIEAGTPFFDVDITTDNLPQEVARDERAISFVKGCYLGQETVARLDALGHVNRVLARLRLTAAAAVPAPGTELVREGKVVGRVTSSAWSESRGAPIALAYLKRAYAVTDDHGWVAWAD